MKRCLSHKGEREGRAQTQQTTEEEMRGFWFRRLLLYQIVWLITGCKALDLLNDSFYIGYILRQSVYVHIVVIFRTLTTVNIFSSSEAVFCICIKGNWGVLNSSLPKRTLGSSYFPRSTASMASSEGHKQALQIQNIPLAKYAWEVWTELRP